MSRIHTSCAYCGVGCGITVDDATTLSGDTTHPANGGALCVKGGSLMETLAFPNRLLYPRLHGQQVSWDTALDEMAAQFGRIIAETGPESVAFYVSGQLLTEDYYIANKLMKGFIGAANIDTNSRLCMSSAVMAHSRAFGEDVVPGCYDDLEITDLLVITGANTAWTHPVIFRRIQQARARRPEMKMVVIDPRKTMTAEQADLHLALRPGSDVWLFNGLSRYLLDHDLIDNAYIEAHVNGFSELHVLLMTPDYELANVALKCGLTVSELQTFYRWFGENEKAVTLFCQGINQSNQGTDKGNALINTHLLTGRVGKPGASPFSMTGQPNAMGGREVGGLATQLASHMTFTDENCERVARFWNAPNIARKPGLKAVDMFEAVRSGKIRALWVVATNPAVSLPDSVMVREALEKCEFLVVSEMTPKTDTAQFADLLLPAAGWGERGGTVTNSERCITRQRAFTRAPGEAKPDWWAMAELGKRLGYADAFNYNDTADIFREHAALSGFENTGFEHRGRQFDISALATLTNDEYEQFTPRQWPLPAGKHVASQRLFGDGCFSTPNGKANLLAVVPQEPVLKRKAERQEGSWLLNTGRLRDQWHTMTRTGHLSRLMETEPLPKVYVNQQTLQASGFSEGALIRINSQQGSVMTLLGRDDGLRDGEAFMPMHWSDDFSSCSGVNRLVAPVTDAVSGQPQFKQTEVMPEAVKVKWHGLWVGQHEPDLEVSWWARRPLDAGECRRLTDETRTAEQIWFQLAQQGRWLRLPLKDGWLAVKLNQGRIIGLLLVSTTHQQVNIDLLAGLLGLPMSSTALSTTLEQALAGDSRMICSCFRISEKQIVDAISEQGISELSGLQSLLRCGTNCGTCVVELKKLLHKHTSSNDA